jgi:hypothetical protein
MSDPNTPEITLTIEEALQETHMSERRTLTVALAPSGGGKVTVAHGQASTPAAVLIQMTCGGQIWFQTPTYDKKNIYLVATDGGITGNAIVFMEAE